jgi:hypothetical protein
MMAIPLLDFLEGRARQALPFLRSAAAKGLTATAALESIKGLTPTFNRQRMLDIYAVLQERADPEKLARLVGQNVPIPQELHTPSPAEMRSNYQYVVEAIDEFAEPIGYVTISSAIPLSGADIRASAGLIFATQSELYLEEETQRASAVSIIEANVNASVPKP